MKAVCGLSRLQNLAEHHSQEAALQLSHRLSLQLATVESNFDLIRNLTLNLEERHTLYNSQE